MTINKKVNGCRMKIETKYPNEYERRKTYLSDEPIYFMENKC